MSPEPIGILAVGVAMIEVLVQSIGIKRPEAAE